MQRQRSLLQLQVVQACVAGTTKKTEKAVDGARELRRLRRGGEKKERMFTKEREKSISGLSRPAYCRLWDDEGLGLRW